MVQFFPVGILGNSIAIAAGHPKRFGPDLCRHTHGPGAEQKIAVLRVEKSIS